jgi:hypothetical protein
MAICGISTNLGDNSVDKLGRGGPDFNQSVTSQWLPKKAANFYSLDFAFVFGCQV